MTKEELKANELLSKFGYVVGYKADGITEKINENAKGLAVEHALICVDEINKTLDELWFLHCDDNNNEELKEYWNDVKQIILNK